MTINVCLQKATCFDTGSILAQNLCYISTSNLTKRLCVKYWKFRCTCYVIELKIVKYQKEIMESEGHAFLAKLTLRVLIERNLTSSIASTDYRT